MFQGVGKVQVLEGAFLEGLFIGMAAFEARLYDVLSISHSAAFLLSISHQRVMVHTNKSSNKRVAMQGCMKAETSNITSFIDQPALTS